MTINQLPVETIVQILKSCTLTTLFSLHLTHPLFYALTSHHINQIAPAVSWNTFPTGTPLLHQSPVGGQYSIEWLKLLFSQYMATVIVDRHRYGHARLDICWSKTTDLPGPGIPAWDKFGDGLRDRVSAGLRVLKRLPNILDELYQLSDTEVEKMLRFVQEENSWKLHVAEPEKPGKRSPWAVLKYREILILRKRESFLKEAPQQAVLDYILMLKLLESTFLSAFDQWATLLGTFDRDDAPNSDICDMTRSCRFCQDNAWMNWFILNQGPDLFWQQWCPADSEARIASTVIRDRLLESFKLRDLRQINIERNAALRVNLLLRRLLITTENMDRDSRGEHKLSTTTSRLFYQYHMKYRNNTSYRSKVATEENLNHVSYFVDLQVDAKEDFHTAVFGHLNTTRSFVILFIILQSHPTGLVLN